MRTNWAEISVPIKTRDLIRKIKGTTSYGEFLTQLLVETGRIKK